MLRLCNIARKEVVTNAAVVMPCGPLVHLELLFDWEFLAANYTEIVADVSSGLTVHLQPLSEWEPLTAGATKVIVILAVMLGEGLPMAAVIAAMTAVVQSGGRLSFLDDG